MKGLKIPKNREFFVLLNHAPIKCFQFQKKKKARNPNPLPHPSTFQPFTFSFLSHLSVRLHVAGFPAFLLTVTLHPMNNSASPFTSTH